MSIHVELLRSDLAEVVITPSLLRRMLFREREEVRFARRVLVITGGYRWIWDAGLAHVPPDVERAIAAVVRRARRPREFTAVDGDLTRRRSD